MVKRIELEHARDFTGGLNLAKDPYDLDNTESFDMVNVDLDRSGGFGVRRGIRKFINTLTGLSGGGVPDTIYTYVDPTFVRHLLVARDGQVQRWSGAAWVNVQATVISAGRVNFAEMNGNLYFAHEGGGGGVQRWAGVGTSTTLAAPAFADDLGAPSVDKFPQSTSLVVHRDVMWSAVGSRLRWSHPGTAEAWRTNDWIDVDEGADNGKIRALVPFGDRLLVFKNRSVYAVHGVPPSGFTLQEISRSVGASNQTAVCRSEDAAYFWDKDTGLWKYDGDKLEWVFERVYPIIDDNKMNTAFSHQAFVAYHRRRVFVSLPWSAVPFAGRYVTMVYGDDIGKHGAWTLHDIEPFSLHVHRQSDGGDIRLLGGSQGYVYEFDAENYFQDELISGATKLIKAYYTTRWFDAGNSALRKRWKRPVVVARGGANQKMYLDVMTDYNPTRITKTFELSSTLDGTEMVWDVANWDANVWAGEVGERSDILKGSQLGTGTAKAIRFSNGTAQSAKGLDWRVHGLTMKWIAKRIRN